MNITQNLDAVKLTFVIIVAIGAIVGALFCQHVFGWQPCPLCIMQRVAFIGMGIFSGIALALNSKNLKTASTITSLIFAELGTIVAGYHWWVLKHPGQSCGVDPLETAINALKITDIFPWMFKVDGFCTTPYPPIFGLELPVWSAILLLLSSSAILTTLPWVKRLNKKQLT
jgi:disulfide bond formation protein DsbB